MSMAYPPSEPELPHTCHALGCQAHCPPEYLMCGRHWRMVARPTQLRVYAAYRRGQCDDRKVTGAWYLMAEQAVLEVAAREGRLTPDQCAVRMLQAQEYARLLDEKRAGDAV